MSTALIGAAAMMGRRRASAGGGFDPLTLPGLTAMFRQSLTGSPVSQWNDDTGNARHLTQATPGLQPAVGTLAGNAAPDFNQASAQRMDGLGVGQYLGSGDFEIWVVFRIPAVVGNGANYYDAPAIVTDTDGWFALTIDGTRIIWGYNNGSTGDQQCVDTVNLVDTNVHVARCRLIGSTLYLRVDDRVEITNGATGPGRRVFTSNLRVGASWDTLDAVGGSFHAATFNAGLSAGDATSFYAWIAATYPGVVVP